MVPTSPRLTLLHSLPTLMQAWDDERPRFCEIGFLLAMAFKMAPVALVPPSTTNTLLSPNDDQVDLRQWQDECQLEQEIMLNLWEDWCEAKVKDQSYRLKRGWTPPSHEELKKFIRWVIQASGHDLSLPSMRGIGIRLSKFFSGVLRRTGYAFPEADKKELHDFIKHRLRREQVVTSETKPKLAFKCEDQKNFMLTTALYIYCYTGARLGAIVPLDSTVEARNSRIKKKEERIVRPGSNFLRTTRADKDELSGIRWRDVEFTLIRRRSGPPELVFTLSQAWIKNNLGDTNNGLKTGLTHRDHLIRDPIPWVLALAFADRAFKKYETVEQLWAERVTSRRECLRLVWKKEKENLHVFRPSLHSASALNQKAFNRMFDLLMRQTGYTRKVSVQRIREEVTNVVDKANVTEAQRKHAVGHSKSVFNQSYIHSLSALDIQALYLGEPQRQDHLELLSSLTSVLVRGYPFKLPNDERDRVLGADVGYQNLKRERAQNRVDMQACPDSQSLQAKEDEFKKKIDRLRYRLKEQALKVYQKKWLDESEADGTFKEDQAVQDINALRFAHLLLFAPNRLAVTAAMNGQCDYSHETRPALINCLTQMAQEHEVVLHRPGEVPVAGLCPANSCGAKLTGNFYDRQLHVHNCRRKEAELNLWVAASHLDQYHGISGLLKLATMQIKPAPVELDTAGVKRKCDSDSDAVAKRRRSLLEASISWPSQPSGVGDTSSPKSVVTPGAGLEKLPSPMNESLSNTRNSHLPWEDGSSVHPESFSPGQNKDMFNLTKVVDDSGIDSLDDLDEAGPEYFDLSGRALDDIALIPLEGFEDSGATLSSSIRTR
ncbi:hypothetical protein DV735_g4286, partial [Chaetothyriales sp. CBS 134920]